MRVRVKQSNWDKLGLRLLALVDVGLLGAIVTAALLWSGQLHAQQPAQLVRGVPDCQVFYMLTSGTLVSGNIDNRQNGCTFWSASYNNYASGFSALTFTVQSSANNAAGTGPASFGTFAGTVVTGANPSTATDQAYIELTGYNPWVRVVISGLTGTGTVQGTLYGWKSSPSSTAVIIGTSDVNVAEWGGTPTTLGQKTMVASVPVVIASNQSAVTVQGGAANGAALSGNPVPQAISDATNARIPLSASAASNGNTAVAIPAVAPSLFNGATWDRQLTCSTRVAISTSSSGATQIVAASGSTIVRVCGMNITTASPVTVSLVRGTGANCVTGTATIAGPYTSVSALALPYPQNTVLGAASDAVCINLGTAVAVSGEAFVSQN